MHNRKINTITIHSLYDRPTQVTISISPIKCHTVKQDTLILPTHATDCTEHDHHKANKTRALKCKPSAGDRIIKKLEEICNTVHVVMLLSCMTNCLAQQLRSN